MSAVQAAAGFGLSFLSLYLAWRIYRAGAEDPATLQKAGDQFAP